MGYSLAPDAIVEHLSGDWLILLTQDDRVLRLTGDSAAVMSIIATGGTEIPRELLTAADTLTECGVLVRDGRLTSLLTRRNALLMGVGTVVGLSVLSLPSPAAAASISGLVFPDAQINATNFAVTLTTVATKPVWEVTLGASVAAKSANDSPPATMTVTAPKAITVEIFLVGGGGPGNRGSSSSKAGGGGGGGDYNLMASLPLTAGQTFTLQIGRGGAGKSSGTIYGGETTTVNATTSGGGNPGLGGLTRSVAALKAGGGGGSTGAGDTAGTGTAGGTGRNTVTRAGGGGGGSTGAAGNATGSAGGTGSAGTSIATGTFFAGTRFFGTGGGGGRGTTTGGGAGGSTGQIGAGGAGGDTNTGGSNGYANSGAGGGGAGNTTMISGSGSHGVVWIRKTSA